MVLVIIFGMMVINTLVINIIILGGYVNGVKEGEGVLYYKSGAVYEGEWKNGKQDGRGKIIKE
jgi:hypothetical protein